MSGEVRQRRISGWLRIGVSAGLLAALLFLLDLGEIGAAIVHASPLLLLLLLLVIYGERIYSALRWYQVLRWNSAGVPLHIVVRISFISSFAGLFLPGALGTEAFRVMGLARYSSNLAMAFSSVLVDRLLAVLTLVPFVFVGLALAPPGMHPNIRITAWIALGLALLAAFLMLHRAPRRLLQLCMPTALEARVQPRLERLYAALDGYLRRPRMLIYAVLLAVGFQLLRILVVWISARAVGIDIPVAYFFIFAPVIVLLSMAPISLGGIGVREATYVYLFGLVGVAAEQAFAASVLVHILGLVSCLPGAWLYARAPRPRPVAQEVQLCVRS
jgi:glycosyltransferase 2 family protein